MDWQVLRGSARLPGRGAPNLRLSLGQAQQGGKFIAAKPLKGFGGAGVLEVVENYQSDTFRCVYSVTFAGAVYVLHTFQKKSKLGSKTPKQEIDLMKARLKAAEEHYREWSKKKETP